MNERDYELLSTYIDGALTARERTLLEQRLAAEPELRRELDSLRQTVRLIRQMPALSAPRDFTLTSAMAGVRSATRPVLPFPLTAAFSAMSAAAAILMFVFGGYFLLQSDLVSMTAPNNLVLMQREQAQDVASVPSPAPAMTRTALPTLAMPTASPALSSASDEALAESGPAAANLAAAPEEETESDPGEILMYSATAGAADDEAETEADTFAGLNDADGAVGSAAFSMEAAEIAPTPELQSELLLSATEVALAPAPEGTLEASLRSLPIDVTALAEVPEDSSIAPPGQGQDQAGAAQVEDTQQSNEPLSDDSQATKQFAPTVDDGIIGLGLLIAGTALLIAAIITTLTRRRRLNV